MKPKNLRLVVISASVTLALVATLLVMQGLKQAAVYFYLPSDVVAKGGTLHGERIRLGGLVEQGSIRFDAATHSYRFTVTDGQERLSVNYNGILPSLFREGQGVVTEGTISTDGTLRADTVLAKHDENYMPPDVKRGLDTLRNNSQVTGS